MAKLGLKQDDGTYVWIRVEVSGTAIVTPPGESPSDQCQPEGS